MQAQQNGWSRDQVAEYRKRRQLLVACTAAFFFDLFLMLAVGALFYHYLLMIVLAVTWFGLGVFAFLQQFWVCAFRCPSCGKALSSIELTVTGVPLQAGYWPQSRYCRNCGAGIPAEALRIF